MRLPSLPPERLTSEQRKLYDRNLRQMQEGFTAFKTRAKDGSLLGPWGVFLHEPGVGAAHYDVIDAITALKRLPDSVKQVAIITTGARFKAAYKVYAHVATAGADGMDPAKLATLAAGRRPADLTPDEGAAFEVTTALLDGGVLPGPAYAATRDRLGQGATERAGVLDRVLRRHRDGAKCVRRAERGGVDRMTTMYVTYKGTPDSRFDRDYWLTRHSHSSARAGVRLGWKTCPPSFPANPVARWSASRPAVSATNRRCGRP